MPDQLRSHLLVDGFVTSSDFKSPLSVQRDPAPQRKREAHGARLLNQVQALVRQSVQLNQARVQHELPSHAGMTVAIEVRPKGALDPKTFEWKRDGVEVLTVGGGDAFDLVTIHVPDGKLGALERRVEEYVHKNNRAGTKPANASLINAIENVRHAAFAELWTTNAPLPADDDVRWYQVWLRQPGKKSGQTRDDFAELAARLGIVVEPGYVSFPGRVVVAVQCTRQALESALQLLDMVAEIRSVEPTAEFFLAHLKPAEQAEWIEQLVARTVQPDGQAPFITLLDTGVNRGHPLLRASLDVEDVHTVHPQWPADDHVGHGTEMAGLALYGDLTPVLASNEQVSLSHRLESVKIWPNEGENPTHLYGPVCIEAVSRVEVQHAGRRRTFAMMTTSGGTNIGEPSEWSATIDQLAFGRAPLEIGVGAEDDEDDYRVQRLFVLSAGNVPWQEWVEYPDRNSLSPIQNPAQAWNALTVGAATDLTELDENRYPNYVPIAPAGALSPSSTTAMLWKRPWPYKPDVVAEGGNGSLEHGLHVSVGPEPLRLLTTSHEPLNQPFAESGDTSAAAAQVARVCTRLAAAYPDYWPETIRALVIHGARYTKPMRDKLGFPPRRRDKEALLNTYGYGMVSLENSSYSTNRRPTLIVQQTFYPYRLEGGTVRLGQMQLHDLPWPTEQLVALGEAQVTLRITLSYFVEPNPSKRGWQSKFRYQSFALRFAVKAATETDEEFLARVNKLERDPDSDDAHGDADAADWTFGAMLRSRGSVHSDIWTGTAAQLAAKSQVVVFPVGGWWKDWKEAAQHGAGARYALVVSLDVAESIETDIYTPIANEIAAAVAIDIPGRA